MKRTLVAAGLLAVCAVSVTPQLRAQTVVDIPKEIETVRKSMATKELKDALAFVAKAQADPSDVVQDWIGVCNAYGPSRDEVYRSNHIYKMFRIYGLEHVYIDRDRNVIAVRPGTGGGPKAVLTAHHDNVALWPKDQPIEAFARDGRVYCPAAGDDLVGVVQLFTVLRAMNEANLQTKGDVWFVTLTGEESGSVGAENFARGNYPHNLDWRKGDAVVQLHGGAGEGVTTGSQPIITLATLRFFSPFERHIEGQSGADRRWRPHAVDVMAHAIGRIRAEITDPRSDCLRCGDRNLNTEQAEWYVNMSQLEASAIRNRPGSEAAILMDIRADDWEQMRGLHQRIMKIADESCKELTEKGSFGPHKYKEQCSFSFRVDETYGRDWKTDPIQGFDKLNNPGARYVAAAAHALYGFPPIIETGRGCGDCSNMYKAGFPGFSFRGSVVDYGNGKFERGSGGRQGGHDVTESQAIVNVWAGVKHALVFATSYAQIATGAAAK
jgi:acetylornithine deacetylase/succinyl-diaminopimelate desuccinylase-like protein